MKRPQQSLAILGGTPAFEETLHVGRPHVDGRAAFLARVRQMLDRACLTNNGPFVGEFERQVAERAGTKHCVATCNATIALQIAIRALGLQGEVILPALTFIATAHALDWQRLSPVFADVDPLTHNLDPACLEELITPRTSGIIGVHLWGRACDTEAIELVARRHGLQVMYDAAHAFGCTHRRQPVGRFGACAVFSFHATKCIHSGEGGAIVTNSEALAQTMRLMRNFGFAGYDEVVARGTNGKMTELSAALGLTSLEAMGRILAANRRNYECYRQHLHGLAGLSLIHYDPAEKHNYHYVVVEVEAGAAGLTRDELVRVLQAENVLARRYFWPGCHRLEPYRSAPPPGGWRLPATERLAARLMVLPTGTGLGLPDIRRVCDLIRAALAQAPRIRRALPGASAAKTGPDPRRSSG